MLDIEVRANVGEVIRDLNALDPDIKRGVRRRLRDAGRPIGREIVAEGSADLPVRGGLREHMTRRATVTVGMNQTGIRLRLGRKGAFPSGPDQAGIVRHPVFGNRKAWRVTSVRLGTYTEAFEGRAEQIGEAIGGVVDDVLDEFSRK